jgi:hypothetical protein
MAGSVSPHGFLRLAAGFPPQYRLIGKKMPPGNIKTYMTLFQIYISQSCFYLINIYQ